MMRPRALAGCAALILCAAPVAAAEEERDDDGAYGRLDGDVTLSLEVGASESLGGSMGGEASRGESLAVRGGWLFLHSAGVAVQYNESFDLDPQPIRRALSAGVEIRPLFVGRFARDLERGPPLLDLWLDATALYLGLYNLWRADRFCPPTAGCHDYGMEVSLGTELPFIMRASTPFVSLRGAVRWSMAEGDAPHDSVGVGGLLTLAIGYHHLFDWGLVDVADRLPP
jgi:hypothetical protein